MVVTFDQMSTKRKRHIVLEEAHFACEKCGFNQTRPDGKCIIQVDHKDGDDTNWSRDNLWALCPNCHAVHTPHFMFYGRKHTGDMSRFNKSRYSVMDNTSASEAEDSGFESQ
jgi:hypothetical protein